MQSWQEPAAAAGCREGFACTACTASSSLGSVGLACSARFLLTLFLLGSRVGGTTGMGWFGVRCLGDAVLFGGVLARFGLEETLRILF